MNGEEGEECEIWIPYAQKQEWRDVRPIRMNQENDAVVQPRYDPAYVDIYDYLRTVQSSGEQSERALALCKDGLYLNPANYSLWQFYRALIRSLNKDLTSELDYITAVIASNSKNYQVWYHRKAIVEKLDNYCKSIENCERELSFTEGMLSADSKNYHAWQHRQWALDRYKCYGGELAFTSKLLNRDLMNNSAWNHRYLAMRRMDQFRIAEVFDSEFDMVANIIKIVVDNDAAWYYFVALLRRAKNRLNVAEATDFANNLYKNGSRQVPLLRFLVDVNMELVKSPLSSTGQVVEADKMVRSLIEELRVEAPMRKLYWQHLDNQLKACLKTRINNIEN